MMMVVMSDDYVMTVTQHEKLYPESIVCATGARQQASPRQRPLAAATTSLRQPSLPARLLVPLEHWSAILSTR